MVNESLEDKTIWNEEEGRVEFADPKKELASRQLAIDVAIEDGKIYDKLGYLGGVGIFYLGLRAAGILMGIGPDLNSNETSLPDFFGFISTYVGGVCWLSGKINEVEERGCKKDYKNYLEKMGNSTLETK